MKINMSFEDWKPHNSGFTIYPTKEGVRLSSGDFHSGTVFEAEIKLDAENETFLRESLKQGYNPIFRIYKESQNDQEKE
ncbi:MAG: hypothetical protein V1701_02815 [Planctomycetota bacterium]